MAPSPVGLPRAEQVVFYPIVHHIGAHGKLFGNLVDGLALLVSAKACTPRCGI